MPRELTALHREAESPRTTRRPLVQCTPITFGQGLSRYLEDGGDDRFSALPKEHLEGVPLGEITQEVIDELARVAYRNVGVSTIVRQWYGPIAAVLHFAASQGFCEYRQVKLPRLPTTSRLRWISPADSRRFADACSPHFLPMYLFLQHTAALPAETIFLEWRQVDLSRREVEFPSSADDDERTVRLQSIVVAALQTLPHRNGAVFRRPDGEPYKRTGRSAAAVKTAFAAACRRAGISDFTLRDVRATACLWHYAINRDPVALMHYSGSRDHRAVARYKRIAVADLDALQAALREQEWDAAFADLVGAQL